MILPNIKQAEIRREKITHYLLSPTHPIGRSKAEFFLRFGFSLENWESLARALIRHAEKNPVALEEYSEFGKRYIIEGPLETPDGRNPAVKTVWFVEFGETAPHLVTAYSC